MTEASENWDRLVRATLQGEQLRHAGQGHGSTPRRLAGAVPTLLTGSTNTDEIQEAVDERQSEDPNVARIRQGHGRTPGGIAGAVPTSLARPNFDLILQVNNEIQSEDPSVARIHASMGYPQALEPEAKVADFVPVKLSYTNYLVWKILMREFIEGQGLFGYILDTIPAPPIDNPNYTLWKKADKLLRRWMLATITEDLILPVVRLSSAREVWSCLERNLHLPFHATGHDIDLEEGMNNISNYLPLHIAAVNGDWVAARRFLFDQPRAVRAAITGFRETALIVAIRSQKRNEFVRHLLRQMERGDVALKDVSGATALHVAAMSGNVEAARLLVQKNGDLPNIADKEMFVPLHAAAAFGNKEMVVYLLRHTRDNVEPNPFQDERGAQLLNSLAFSGLYDIASELLRRYPKLASMEPYVLVAMAFKRSAFRSGTNLNIWERLIYPCVGVPVELETIADRQSGGDIKNPANCVISVWHGVKQKWLVVCQKVPEIFVPWYKCVRGKKLIHHQALELVKCFCQQVVALNSQRAPIILGDSVIEATKAGIHEIVEEILVSFPSAIHVRNENGQSLFQLAIVHRREKVFNLVYQLPLCRHLFLSMRDASTNNALHLAGRLAPQQELSLRASAAGAALQMQRELQWFKEVKKFVQPQDKEHKNGEGKTPANIFSETHKDLIKEGEQWMRSTTSSCTIVAALIATGVFAAAINKIPSVSSTSLILSKEPAFRIFAISDALALVSSVSSILTFLSILTSRYAEDDFLYALPNRLIIGLLALFLSIILMMVVFGATLYLVFNEKKNLAFILGAALPCVPVTVFLLLISRLLYVITKSTYFPGIFGKQSDRVLF